MRLAGLARPGAYALVAVAAAACEGRGCRRSAAIAELVASSGEASRAVGGVRDWRPAQRGDGFALGDALRTGAASSARVRFTAGGELNVGAASLVRFVARPLTDRRAGLRVESGEAEFEPGDSAGEIVLETALGGARVERGARVRVRATGADTRLEVVVGRVVLESNDAGREVVAQAGERIVVQLAGAIVEAVGGRGDAGAIRPRDAAAPPLAAVVDAAATIPLADAAAVAAAADAGGEVDSGGASSHEARVAVLVRGRGAEVREPGADAWRPLAPGRGAVPAGSSVRLSQGTRAIFARDRERERVRGPTEVRVGGAGERLVDEAPPDAPGGAAAGAHASSATNAARGPRGPQVGLSAGESGTIHASASGPVTVRVGFGTTCRGGAELRLDGHRGAPVASGADAAVVALGPGAHRYELRCLVRGEPAAHARATGRLRVVRDAGRAAMPRRAPHSDIDTDGRRYSVLYQNLLPEITVRWPGAPAGGSYALVVRDRAGRTRTYRASDAAGVTVPSGQLAEGSYKIWFQPSGRGARSPETTVRIAFDNAARTAQIAEPAANAVLAGPTVRVVGTAVAGSTVTAGGVRLPLDAQNRFRGTVPLPAGGRGLTIRIAHPAHGVHYFLRGGAEEARTRR